MNKYRAVRTQRDGITFHSKREADRYSELKLLERAGKIDRLELQFPLRCIINNKLICTYNADFHFWDNEHEEWVVEDAKGYRTALYKLKKKLVEALYGIEIRET